MQHCVSLLSAAAQAAPTPSTQLATAHAVRLLMCSNAGAAHAAGVACAALAFAVSQLSQPPSVVAASMARWASMQAYCSHDEPTVMPCCIKPPASASWVDIMDVAPFLMHLLSAVECPAAQLAAAELLRMCFMRAPATALRGSRDLLQQLPRVLLETGSPVRQVRCSRGCSHCVGLLTHPAACPPDVLQLSA